MQVYFGNYHSDPFTVMNTNDLMRSDKPWRLVLVLRGSKLSHHDLGMFEHALLDVAKSTMTWDLMCERQVSKKMGPLVLVWTVRRKFYDYSLGENDDVQSQVTLMNTLNTRLINLQQFQPV